VPEIGRSNHCQASLASESNQTGILQGMSTSIISRIVETWEELPVDIRVEERKSVMRRKIKAWIIEQKK
jgi:hypothetical protein